MCDMLIGLLCHALCMLAQTPIENVYKVIDDVAIKFAMKVQVSVFFFL